MWRVTETHSSPGSCGLEAGTVACKRTNAADTEAQQQVASKQVPL